MVTNDTEKKIEVKTIIKANAQRRPD